MQSIVIVGGGPAGIMAAVTAAEAGAAQVAVLDAGNPLATLLRTGGGRCNLTNAEEEPRRLAECYPRGGKALLSAFSRFGSRQTMEWFTSRGVALAVEEGGRVFPASRRAAEVRDALLSAARGLGVSVRGETPVVGINPSEDGFAVETPLGVIECAAVAVATGGDWRDEESPGYRLARALGHSTTPLQPALSALRTRGTAALAGLTLPDARIQADFGGREAADERGSLLFTHTGISGPLAFRVSSRCAYLPFSAADPLCLRLSLLPEADATELDAELARAFSARPRRSVLSALRGFVPRTMAGLVLSRAGAAPELPAGQLSREMRRTVARLLTALPLQAVGREDGGEIVTAGGIRLEEVDPRTMESRIVPGLFFCGEILDIDGFTGGYNLQAAWSTGRLAGLALAARVAGAAGPSGPGGPSGRAEGPVTTPPLAL